MDFDTVVRRAVYEHIVATTKAPTVAALAMHINATAADVSGALQRLFGRRTIVLAADGESIVMAPPFAARPTQ